MQAQEIQSMYWSPSIWTRRYKAMYQLMSLVHTSIDGYIVLCKILSESKNEYTVGIILNPSQQIQVQCFCNCNDFLHRGIYCKHIFWISYHKMACTHPNFWTYYNVIDLITSSRLISLSPGRNDECPICLDPINYKEHDTICCNTVCQNSFHSKCWKEYVKRHDKADCIMCRSNLLNPVYES
jgi:hypothetical protein